MPQPTSHFVEERSHGTWREVTDKMYQGGGVYAEVLIECHINLKYEK